MKIAVATGNRKKFREIATVLAEFQIEPEYVEVETDESGTSLDDIVVSKAQQAFEKIKKPLIVDDTGIFFCAFKNFPGHLSKRIFNSIGYEGIFRHLESRMRDAYFRTLICYIDESTTRVFEGTLHGTITHHVYEAPGFNELPFVKIFIPNNHNIPLSMMSIEKIAEISHRGKAVRKFGEFFMEMNEK